MISFKFIRSSFIYTISGALPLAAGFLLLGVYTQSLDKAVYGKFILYMSFTLLMQIIVNLGLDSSFQFFYYDQKDNPKKLNQYLSTVLMTILFTGLFFIVVSFLVGPFILNSIFGIEFFPYGLICLVTAICNSLLKSYCNLLINQQKPARYFILNFIVFFIIVLLTSVFLYFHPNTLFGPLGSRLVAGAIIFIIILYFLFREIGVYFSFTLLKQILIYNTPLFIMLVLTWVQNYSDRIIIGDFEEVGIYDFAFKCTVMLDFLIAGLNSTITPKIYSYWSETKIKHSTMEVNRYWNAITSLIVICTSLTIAIIPLLLTYIDYKHNYIQARNFIPLLSLTFLFRCLQMMFVTPLLFFKSTKSFPIIYAIIAIIQVGLNYVLIKSFGVNGAIWAIFIVKTLELILLYSQSRKIFSFKFNTVKLIWLPLIFFVSVVFIHYLIRPEIQSVVYLFLTCIVTLSILMIYRKELSFTYMTWKNKLTGGHNFNK